MTVSIHDNKPIPDTWFLANGVKYLIRSITYCGGQSTTVQFESLDGRTRYEISVSEWLTKCKSGGIRPNIPYVKKFK